MKIEVSNGEIMDKLSIIQLKLERISDESKLQNLRKEFEVLKEASAAIMSTEDPLYSELFRINSELWDIEDRIRDLERKKDFGEEFIKTARSVYFRNDERSEIKRKINIKTSSGFIEEKSYEKY
jgi:predicted  nucleic acid-binding Zn-ribbon protein